MPGSPEHRAVPDEDAILEVLRSVVDPELGSDIVDLGMLRGVDVDDAGEVTVRIGLTTAGCPLRAQIQQEVRARIAGLPGVAGVEVKWGVLDPDEKAATMARARQAIASRPESTSVPPSTKVLLVASGKGGVGKSSVSVNLATTLALRGYAVGLLDADIWGFSAPRMLGSAGRLQADGPSGRILPQRVPVGDGMLELVSMGLLVDEESSALMWRGLILNRAVRHFLEDVSWGQLDYLLVDMPPGTGDVQMGIARMLPRSEMIVVTTPALTAQNVAARVVDMGRKNRLRIVGVVENMSAYTDEFGRVHEIFGSGGGERLARQAGVPLLGRLPLEPRIAEGSDTGSPEALRPGVAGKAFSALADRVVELCPPTDLTGCTARMLSALDSALDTADGARGTSDYGVGSPVSQS